MFKTIRQYARWLCCFVILWALMTCSLYQVAVQGEAPTASNWH